MTSFNAIRLTRRWSNSWLKNVTLKPLAVTWPLVISTHVLHSKLKTAFSLILPWFILFSLPRRFQV